MGGHPERHIGHNPTGSVAIYLLLLLTLAVGCTGFFAFGSEEQQGAVAGWLSVAQGRTLKKLHEASAILMLMLVIAHIIGVVVESVLHRENLARSMGTGTKLAPSGSARAQSRPLIAVLMVLAMGAFAIWWFLYALHGPIKKQVGHSWGASTLPMCPSPAKNCPTTPSGAKSAAAAICRFIHHCCPPGHRYA
jgi:uncharacterized BrkB/YihY/UPF0761 family membrane protein